MVEVKIGIAVMLTKEANTIRGSKMYRVKEITPERLTIEGCSIGYPCVSRKNIGLDMCSCKQFLYGDWQSQIEVVP